MSTGQKRDAGMDRLLRTVLKPALPKAAGECPEAGLLSAFVEGSLGDSERPALETHVADCARCQEVLAVLSHDLPNEGAAVPAASWFTWVTQPRLRWLVPITAVGTVAVVFLATRPLIAPEGGQSAVEVARVAEAPSTPAELSIDERDAHRQKSAAVRETSGLAAPARRDEVAKAEVGQAPAKSVEPAAEALAARITQEDKRTQAVAADAVRMQAAAEPAPAAPAAVAPRKDVRRLDAGLMTVSAPGGSVVWRLGAGGQLWRSADGGETWHDQPSGLTADLLAGAAPFPATCWIVGAAGTVLLTTDGERWERRPFPLAIDLVAVEAPSARAAIVTARDGRRFETLDAGRTWAPKQ